MTHTNAEKMIKNAPVSDYPDDLAQILEELGNPHRNIGIIKVCGDSGKSSVCTLLSSVLSAAGLKTGRLVTPFIHSIADSICIYEKPISIDFFSKSADKVYKAINRIKKSRSENVSFEPGMYSVLYAVAFVAFCDAGCDHAVIEIPGDSLSHTALTSPVLSVISSVHSIESTQKICSRLDRNSKEVVCAVQSREIYKLISDKCAETNTRLSMPIKNSFCFMSSAVKHMEFTYRGTPYSSGCGAYYQTHNLLTVLEATEALRRLGIRITGTDICSAVLCEGIPLRFEIISVMPTIIVDRADTPDKRKAFLDTLKKLEGQISKTPTVICEKNSKSISDEFLSINLHAKSLETTEKELKKQLRSLCGELSEDSTLIVLGSSEYCETAAKLIKEALM